ncbi:MAG: IS110 family transposase [Gemmatimonadaceae bacterium]
MKKRPSSGTRNKGSRVWEQINEHAAGVDAGAEHHWVAVPEESASPSVRKFATNTAGLYELADWLAACGVSTVAVEATGVYCVPLLEILDARGLDVVLAKPSSLKSVNDRRKTDMVDCQWIQLLHTFGLLRGSLRPTAEVAVYRTYNRHRQTLIAQATTAIEHIKKALTLMNIRLDRAVSDVTGETGMRIIRAILVGERDPQALAAMRDERCAKSEAGIAEDLTGKWADHHLFVLKQAVASWDHLQVLIRDCSTQIEKQAETFEKKKNRSTVPKPRRREHVRKNVLPFEARELFYEILGQDLTQIDGISVATVSAFIAEVGTDVSAFKSEKNFCSWLKACPGSKTSGGKNRSGRNLPTGNRLWTALRIAAQTLSRSKSALGVFYRRLRARLGPEKAINAAAHKLARMIYFALRLQRPYVDPGPDAYTERHRSQILKTMEKRARQLGYTLVKAT